MSILLDRRMSRKEKELWGLKRDECVGEELFVRKVDSMNVLLANMPIEFNKRESLEPPLGICYLAAMLKDIDSVKVFLRDYEVAPFSDKMLRMDLLGLKIDLLGVSFRTASYRSAKEYIKGTRDGS